jgi:hypothetical protein
VKFISIKIPDILFVFFAFVLTFSRVEFLVLTHCALFLIAINPLTLGLNIMVTVMLLTGDLNESIKIMGANRRQVEQMQLCSCQR